MKQRTLSQSSVEAEYHSMATTSWELKWMAIAICEYRLMATHDKPMHLHCDPQVALHIATNPIFNERTKHIEVNCYFVCDEIQRGNIATCYVQTTN